MDNKKTQVVNNVLKFTGEMLVLPGISQLVDKKWKYGVWHVAGGVLVRTLIGGPVGLLVAANSFSLSMTGKNLPSALFGPKDPRTVNLEERVNQELGEGLTLEEIQEGVIEDIEDIYQETITVQDKKMRKNRKQK